MIARTRSASLLLLSCFSSAAIAQQHLPTNDDLRHLRTIANPQLSPDGRHVVATITDSTADGGKTHLWLLSTEGAQPRQLTFSQGESTGERQPEYLLDGSAVLFSSRREGKASLFRLPLDGGEAIPLKLERVPAAKEPALPVSILSYTLSPDGNTLAVVATDPESAARTKDKRDKKDVIWVEHDDLEHRLYLVDTKTWAAREVPTLTDPDNVTWSEQSDRLIVLKHTRLRDLGPGTVGYVVSVAHPEDQKKIANLPESTRRVAFTHNDDRLVLAAKCELDSPEGCADVFLFDLSTGKLRNLTGKLKDTTLSGDPLTVAPDDRSILVGLTRGMKRGLGEIDVETGNLHMLDFGLPTISGFRQQGKASAYVYVGSSSTSPGAVYLTTSLDQPGRKLVQPELMPATWIATAPQPLSFKRAGFNVEGLLYLPPQATSGSVSGKIPLIVNVHGGPRGQFTDTYSPLTNLLLGQGWAVLITNPRGSTGYGVAFEAANKDDMGNGDYLDIMAAVDEAIRTAPIDPARLALIGYSYGGEMAGFVEGKTTRFKAIVSGAPVIDQFSEYGTESESYGDRWYTGQPWRHFESAWRQSPLAYAEHAKTPFLLLQGQSDTTDPEGQSREYYRALRQEGVPVQLLLFPREDHGALGANFSGQPSTEPWAGITAREHMINFINDAFNGKVEPNKP